MYLKASILQIIILLNNLDIISNRLQGSTFKLQLKPTIRYIFVRREFLDIKYSLFTERFKFVEKWRFIFLPFFDQTNS